MTRRAATAGRKGPVVVGAVIALAAAALAGCAPVGKVRDVEYLAWVDAGPVGSVEYSTVDDVGALRRLGEGVVSSSWVKSVRASSELSVTVTPGTKGTAHCGIVDVRKKSIMITRNGRPGESITCRTV